MEPAGNGQRRGHAESRRNRPQPVRPIEVDVLAGVQHIEPADPGANGRTQKPGFPAATAACSQPSADRRNRHRQAEEQLGPGRVPLRQRIPEDHGERDGREEEAQGIEPPGGIDEDGRRECDEHAGFSDAHGAARNLAVRRSWIQGVEPRVDEPVEPHGRTPRRHHCEQNPPDRRPRHHGIPRRQQRTRERKRQRKQRVAEADEGEIGCQALEHLQSAIVDDRRSKLDSTIVVESSILIQSTGSAQGGFPTADILPHRRCHQERRRRAGARAFRAAIEPYSDSNPRARAP